MQLAPGVHYSVSDILLNPRITLPPHKLTIIPGLCSQCGLQGSACNHSTSARITISVRRSSSPPSPHATHIYTPHPSPPQSGHALLLLSANVHTHNTGLSFSNLRCNISFKLEQSDKEWTPAAAPGFFFLLSFLSFKSLDAKWQQLFTCQTTADRYFCFQAVCWLTARASKSKRINHQLQPLRTLACIFNLFVLSKIQSKSLSFFSSNCTN